MKTWKDNLDARISRCDCGAWCWDGRCPMCDPLETTKENAA